VESPFEILGIEPDADEERIERAYRARIKEVHPDHGGSIEAFQSVRAAYEEALSGGVRAAARAGDDDADESATAEPASPVQPTVEYLNYEVLDDHGWTLADDDLFEKAAAADLAPDDHGEFTVGPDETVLEAAEACGFTWPFACRGGACSNCAMAVLDGECPPPVNHVLTSELLDRGIRLSCSVRPVTGKARVVYNVKHLPGVDELLLPASRFEKASSD